MVFALCAQQDNHLRVSVDLVQVDATVTGSEGHPVSDLKSGDFRVLLDGRPQPIRFCNFMRREGAAPRTATVAVSDFLAASAAQPAAPPSPIKRHSVRRAIVLFIGDLLTSSESIPGIRNGLKKFVLEQVQPGDLVAIVRSSAGDGALQDFTADKRIMLAAIDQVRWTTHAAGMGAASAYQPIGQPELGGFLSGDLAQLDKIDATDRATLLTTASLLRVIHGMADLPGRKSVVLISDGLRLSSPDELDTNGQSANGTGAFLSPIYSSMLRVADESLRAGVVLYAIDTRGPSPLVVGAADRVREATGDNLRSAADGRRAEYRDNQWGSMFLANQTGGILITEANSIGAALERVTADQHSYYLLGFQPPAEALRPGANGKPEYHKLKIEVARAGLKVRSHAGFFGVGDKPIATDAIQLNVRASYLAAGHDSFIRATAHINSKGITFSGPPIHRTGVLHLIVRAFDTNGQPVEGGIDDTRRIDVDEDGYRRAQQYGLLYTTLLPVPRAGPYQVRVSCLEEGTGKSGAGGDFIVVPETKGSGMYLSGIVFEHDLGTDDHIVPSSHPEVYAAGDVVRFSFQVIGAKPAINRMETRTRLFRDGVEVSQSSPSRMESGSEKSGSFAKGSLEIPKELAPGDYQLRVDAERGGQIAAWQWTKLTLQ